MADEGRLADGTTVDLDLTKPTRDYVDITASGHTHTVEEITAHLGCVRHYGNPRFEPSGHYTSAKKASEKIDGRATISGCTIGADYNYSTHAFTHLGAVLEDVTGRPIDRLVEEEIAGRYGLHSLRAMYREKTLRSDYERVRPYSSSGREINYSDNSWKVLGGGLESNMRDLALFARRVKAGQIVDQETREYIWTRYAPTSGSTYGIGWDVNVAGNYVDHGGDGTGTQTYLRVYHGHPTRQYTIALAYTAKNGAPLPGIADRMVGVMDL